MDLTPEKEKVKKLNEKTYSMELILSMDTHQPGGSVAFIIIEGTKKVNTRKVMQDLHR
jgi:hypothetical protein